MNVWRVGPAKPSEDVTPRCLVKAQTMWKMIKNKTCLSQYVTPLGFFHDDQTCIDVIIVCALQLHSAVINCRQRNGISVHWQIYVTRGLEGKTVWTFQKKFTYMD